MMRSFLQFNIRNKLILGFSAILLISSLLIGFLSFQEARKKIESEMLSSAGESIKVLDASINNTIAPKVNNVNYFSKLFTSFSYDQTNLPGTIEKLRQYYNLNLDVTNISIGTQNGSIISFPKQNALEGNANSQDWFQKAMQDKKQTFISEPFIDENSGELTVSVSKASKDGSSVILIKISLSEIQRIARNIKVGQNGYMMVLDQNKQYIFDPKEQIGSIAKSDSWISKLYGTSNGQFSYKKDNDDRKMVFLTNKLTGWKIAGTMYSNEVSKAAQPLLYVTLTVIAAALLVGIGVMLLIVRSITKPLGELIVASEKISNGDLTEEIVVRSNDEIGQLATSFSRMSESLRSLITQLKGSIEQVAASSEQLTASAEQTSNATEMITAAIQQVAAGSEDQTTRVKKGFKLLEGMCMDIMNISDHSNSISNSSSHTKEKAEAGGRLVEKTVQQMISIHQSVNESDLVIQALGHKSEEIDKILNVIKGIASQTNLLALNAAIEAARAGEHGRGFAIVADEVRKLSEKSAQSSSEIAALIGDIQKDMKQSIEVMGYVKKEVQTGMDAASETEVNFKEILHLTEDVSNQIQEMVKTANQMSVDAQQVAITMNGISTTATETSASTQHVATSAEEQSASMEEISSAAAALSKMAEDLHQLINKFKI